MSARWIETPEGPEETKRRLMGEPVAPATNGTAKGWVGKIIVAVAGVLCAGALAGLITWGSLGATVAQHEQHVRTSEPKIEALMVRTSVNEAHWQDVAKTLDRIEKKLDRPTGRGSH